MEGNIMSNFESVSGGGIGWLKSSPTGCDDNAPRDRGILANK